MKKIRSNRSNKLLINFLESIFRMIFISGHQSFTGMNWFANLICRHDVRNSLGVFHTFQEFCKNRLRDGAFGFVVAYYTRLTCSPTVSRDLDVLAGDVITLTEKRQHHVRGKKSAVTKPRTSTKLSCKLFLHFFPDTHFI